MPWRTSDSSTLTGPATDAPRDARSNANIEGGTVVLGHQVTQRLALDHLGVLAQDPRQRPRHGLDATVGRNQHGDGGGVLDQRAQTGVVVVHDLVPPALRQIPHRQQDGARSEPARPGSR